MGISCFDIPYVMGYRRVPLPPASTIPFIKRMFAYLTTSVQEISETLEPLTMADMSLLSDASHDVVNPGIFTFLSASPRVESECHKCS